MLLQLWKRFIRRQGLETPKESLSLCLQVQYANSNLLPMYACRARLDSISLVKTLNEFSRVVVVRVFLGIYIYT